MDEKPERPPAWQSDLAAALRRARIENAERADVVAELREIALGRLALLESALQPVVRQAPPGVDLFDLTLAKGDRPRVFLDMVAFIEMARDRRTYRFFQDTAYGRVLIAESQKIDTIVAACTNYVARRLVERERALGGGVMQGGERRGVTQPPPAAEARPSEEEEDELEATLHAPLAGVAPASAVRTAERGSWAESAADLRPGLARKLIVVLNLLLMALGAAALVVLLVYGGYLAWTHELDEFWTKTLGASPF